MRTCRICKCTDADCRRCIERTGAPCYWVAENLCSACVAVVENEVRALSWKQPFASLMLHGKIETRTWYTPYRGQVLICASQKSYTWDQVLDLCSEEQFRQIIEMHKDERFGAFCGHAIAIGNLVDCRPMYPLDEKRAYVEYRHDLYAHVYDDVQPIVPFPFKGRQGWTMLNEEQKQQIVLLQTKLEL